MSDVVCSHLEEIAVRELPASVDGCEDCLRTDGKWLHLRICLIWNWCYVDEVAFLVDGIRGKTRIPPSPLLQ
jgi:hypothetical protein